MLKNFPAFFSLLALVLTSGCQLPVESRELPALHDRKQPIKKIAVAPFQATAGLARAPTRSTSVPSSIATVLVARYVTEAIAATGAVSMSRS